MALARVKTWNPGDILTANDLNNEFNNILNNPITLISPTTGVINFNSQAHTNFVLENVATTPTAATSGRIVYNTALGYPQVDQGSVVRSIPLVLSTAVSGNALVVGTTGGAFQMSTVGSTTPAVLIVSSSGALQYIMGSSTNTTLMVTSSGATPAFATPTGVTFTPSFTSTETPFSLSSGVTIAHGLGAQPSFATAVFRCVVSTGSYSTGNEIPIVGTMSEANAAGHGAVFSVSSSAVFISVGVSVNTLQRSTAATQAITSSAWQIVARAWT